jgi:hypothetical protein
MCYFIIKLFICLFLYIFFFSFFSFLSLSLSFPFPPFTPSQPLKKTLKICTQRDGYGIQEYSEGYYEGEFRFNQITGSGRLTYSDGSFYSGEWKNDLFCGYGNRCWHSPSISYEGHFSNDVFDGYGIFVDHDKRFLFYLRWW